MKFSKIISNGIHLIILKQLRQFWYCNIDRILLHNSNVIVTWNFCLTFVKKISTMYIKNVKDRPIPFHDFTLFVVLSLSAAALVPPMQAMGEPTMKRERTTTNTKSNNGIGLVKDWDKFKNESYCFVLIYKATKSSKNIQGKVDFRLLLNSYTWICKLPL